MPSLKGPIVGLLVVPFLTWMLYSTAADAQQGIHHEYTGRRAGLKRLLGSLADSLGPTGVLVCGGLLTAAMIGWLIYTIIKRKQAAGAPPEAP